MPPKAKFSERDITLAALSIVREKGIEALTARALGKALKSSVSPVFKAFKGGMEEVKKAVISEARALYGEYVEKGLLQDKAFRGVGLMYIKFAADEPRLFNLLFMTGEEKTRELSSVLPQIDDNYDKILASVEAEFNLGEKKSKWLYRHLWIYTHGIAALTATNTCRFTDAEIQKLLAEVCLGLIKGDGEND